MPSLAGFRWLFWRTPCTLNLLKSSLPLELGTLENSKDPDKILHPAAFCYGLL